MSSSLPSTLPSRPRRTLRSVVASVAALLLATGGLVLASALPAQAHNNNVSATCQALTVDLDMYDPDHDNTVTVTVDGVVVPGWDHKTFGRALDPNPSVIPFSDPSVGHHWTVDVVAWDDADPSTGASRGYSFTKSDVSPACGAPTVALNASTCTTVGGNAGLSATIAGTAAADAYRVELFSGGAVKWTKDYAPGTIPASIDFGAQAAGVGYVVKVSDLTITSITAQASTTAASCPQVGGSDITVTQCTAPGADASVLLTPTGFAAGHHYTVHVGSAAGRIVGDFTYTVGGSSYPIALTPPPTGTGTVDVYVIDDQGGVVSAGPLHVALQACPTQPGLASISVEACHVGQPTSDVTVLLDGLTSGRTYRVSDGVDSTEFVADTTTKRLVLRGEEPGSYTITVIDVAAPGVTASQPVTVEACAAVPTLTLTPTDCTVPNGTGSLSVQVGNLVSGRTYNVSISSGGNPVSGAADQAIDGSRGATQTVSFTVPPRAAYVVTVVDDDDADASATSAPVTMSACPQVGALTVECTVSGSTATLALAATDLVPGDQYTVTFERANSAGVYSVVKQAGPKTSLTAADLSIAGVVQGQDYRVTLVDVSNPALSPEVLNVEIQDGCTTGRVDSVSYTAGRVSALALTGTDTGRLVIIALLLLVPGVGLIGFAILRHRREARD